MAKYNVGDRVPSTGLYAPYGDPVIESTVHPGGDGGSHHQTRTRAQAQLHRTLIEGSRFLEVPELGPTVFWIRVR